jgi:hypothetical protein
MVSPTIHRPGKARRVDRDIEKVGLSRVQCAVGTLERNKSLSAHGERFKSCLEKVEQSRDIPTSSLNTGTGTICSDPSLTIGKNLQLTVNSLQLTTYNLQAEGSEGLGKEYNYRILRLTNVMLTQYWNPISLDRCPTTSVHAKIISFVHLGLPATHSPRQV